MSTENSDPARIQLDDLGPGNPTPGSFIGWDGFDEWLGSERSAIKEILEDSAPDENAKKAVHHFETSWTNMQKNLSRTPENLKRLKTRIQDEYRNRHLFTSESPVAQLLRSVHRTPRAAAACHRLGVALHEPIKASHIQGIVELMLLEKDLNPDKVGFVHEALEKLEKEMRNQAEAMGVTRRDFLNLLEESAADLKGRQKAFDEVIHLDRARKYWRKQERDQNKRALCFGSAFGILLVATIALLFYFVGNFLSGEISPQRVAGVLLAVSPALWGLKIVARLLLSNLHLATDASARQTLIMTYLSLHHEKALDDSQRELLLATIFKPVSTGIVRDDASPNVLDLMKLTKGGKAPTE